MAITMEQALKLKSAQVVYSVRYHNADGTAERWRVSGMPQSWATRPGKFRVPIRHGMYDNWHIDETNAHEFSLKEPACKKIRKVKR